jgi:hypothetical protein
MGQKIITDSKILKQKLKQGFKPLAFNCCQMCKYAELYDQTQDNLRCTYNQNRVFAVNAFSVCRKFEQK